MSPDQHKRLTGFDALPDDSVVDDKVAAEVLNVSVRTLRRRNPVRRIQLSPRRLGRRVGDIRALLRGGAASVPT